MTTASTPTVSRLSGGPRAGSHRRCEPCIAMFELDQGRCSERTMTRMPAGQPSRSSRPVMSATTHRRGPGRRPSQAGVHAPGGTFRIAAGS